MEVATIAVAAVKSFIAVWCDSCQVFESQGKTEENEARQEKDIAILPSCPS